MFRCDIWFALVFSFLPFRSITREVGGISYICCQHGHLHIFYFVMLHFLAFMFWHYIVLGLGFQLGPSGFWSQVFINCDESECKWYSLIIVSKSKAPTCISKWLKGFYFFRRFGEAYCELFKKYVASRQRSLWESKDITDRNSIYG